MPCRCINRRGFGYALASLCFATSTAFAQESLVQTATSVSDWEKSTSLQTWTYATHSSPFADSVLNPRNSILKIARAQYLSDTRLDFSLKNSDADLVLKPRLIGEVREGGSGKSSTAEGYLSQAFGRFRIRPDLTATLGRELLTWGPANFRSPSNPYYYDSGKTRPLEDVPGVDIARIDWSAGRWTSTLGFVSGGRQNDGEWRQSSLLKLAYRGNDFLVGGILSKPRNRRSFVGGYAQFSIGDAWLLYGELSSVTTSNVTTTSSALATATRATVGTIGAAYTFEGGASLSAEYLHDGRGYSRAAQAAYFSAIEESLASSQSAVDLRRGGQSRLLGRDYLNILLQSNLQDPSTYWRVSPTVNLQDRSRQLLLYGEHSLHPRIALFGSLLWSSGGRSTEFGAVVRSTATLGLKIFLM